MVRHTVDRVVSNVVPWTVVDVVSVMAATVELPVAPIPSAVLVVAAASPAGHRFVNKKCST